MKNKFKIHFVIVVIIALIMSLSACFNPSDDKGNEDDLNAGNTNEDSSHVHDYKDGKCECGAEDPNYEAPCTHTPAEATRENVVGATCTEEGSYDEVVKCSACGAELSRERKSTEKLSHTPGEPLRESFVDSTCSAEGNYDEVVKCSVCSEELSREAKVVEKKAHTSGEPLRESFVDSTCSAEGSYDEVVKCSVCSEELSREAKVVEKKAHTSARAVQENVVAATCTSGGSYDSVVYCSVCSEELSRKEKTTDRIAHRASKAVQENVVAATCTSGGSYDSVVYCSVCSGEISRTPKTSAMLAHTYVEGKCSCGAKDPDYKPDYGEATVYEAGDKILFVSSSYSESTVKMTEELERIVGDGGVVVGSIYNANQRLEILFNIEEDDDSRPAIRIAREYLEKMERSSYYNPRYIVYADSGTVAVCFDDVEFTNLAVVEYVARIFIEELLLGKDRVVLPKGVIATGNIDLIAIQEEIDEVNDREAWEKFRTGAKQKYGEEVGEEFYQAFKTYYSMLSEDLYYWYADLYDPGVGGFYASSSGRDSAGFLPLVETSGQIWMQLVSMGLFKETGKNWGDAIPDMVKYQLTYFLKSCQDPNGFFYPPQMEKAALDAHVASRSRNTSRANSTLRSLGSAPTYNTPMGNKGDGITADEFWDNLVEAGLVSADTPRPYVPKSYSDYVEHITKSLGGSTATAVSELVLTDSTSESMKYLQNHANFAAYLNGLNIDGSPYAVGNELNATYTMIAEQARIVGKCEDAGYWYSGMDFKEMLITWLNSHINGKGLFGKYDESSTDPSVGCKYINTNGFFKIMSVYNGYGIAYPEPELAARGCLIGIMSDEVSNGNICETYNIWEGFNLLMINVRTYVEDKELRSSILAEINEAMKDYGPDAVINSYTKQLRYQKADGGFSHNVSKGQTAYQGGVMVGTGVNESNVDACGFGSSSIINAMLDCIGLASYEVQIYRHADYMKFIERLMSRQPVIKGISEGEAYTFDQVPSGDNPIISVADTVKNKVSTASDKALSADSANKVLKFEKTSTDSGMSLISYASDESDGSGCLVYEVDLLYSGITRKNTTEISIASRSHTGGQDKLIYITLDLAGTANGSAIYYSDGYNGATRGQKIDTGAVVGKWFKLRIEVYSDGTAENFRYKTFINDKLIYVSSSIYGTNILSGKTEIYTADELNRVSHYFCYGFNGEFSFDNLRIYHSNKQNRP